MWIIKEFALKCQTLGISPPNDKNYSIIDDLLSVIENHRMYVDCQAQSLTRHDSNVASLANAEIFSNEQKASRSTTDS